MASCWHGGEHHTTSGGMLKIGGLGKDMAGDGQDTFSEGHSDQVGWALVAGQGAWPGGRE
eukprot:3251237-Alexandrium_andersonii.AAC.1